MHYNGFPFPSLKRAQQIDGKVPATYTRLVVGTMICPFMVIILKGCGCASWHMQTGSVLKGVICLSEGLRNGEQEWSRVSHRDVGRATNANSMQPRQRMARRGAHFDRMPPLLMIAPGRLVAWAPSPQRPGRQCPYKV